MTPAARRRDAPKFDFIVVFWGALHRGYFVDLLVASLIAEGNIPAITDRSGSRFLICAPEEDIRAIADHPNFVRLKRLIEVVHVDFPAPEAGAAKMMSMSRGHSILSEMAFRRRSCAVFLTPDLILSAGSIRFFQTKIEAGYAIVLAAAVRFRYEGFVDELRARGFVSADGPLSASGRQLVEMGLRFLHSETLRFDIEGEDFAITPSAVFRRVSGRAALVMNSYSWAPVVLDYSTISGHRGETFENWTLDGDYVFSNFGADTSKVCVIDDSDDCMLVSFTPEAELTFLPLARRAIMRSRGFSAVLKLWFLRAFHHSAAIDPLKRAIFGIPVRWHADGTDGIEWRDAVRASRRLARTVGSEAAILRWFDGAMAYLWRTDLAPIYGDARNAEVGFSAYVRLAVGNLLRKLPAPPVVPSVLSFAYLVFKAYGLFAGPRRPRGADTTGQNVVLLTGPDEVVAHAKGEWRIPSGFVGGRHFWDVRVAGFADIHAAEAFRVGVMRRGAAGAAPSARFVWRGDGRVEAYGRSFPAAAPDASRHDEAVMRVAVDIDARRIWFGTKDGWADGATPGQGAGFDLGDVAAPFDPIVAISRGDANLCFRICPPGDDGKAPPPDFRPLRFPAPDFPAPIVMRRAAPRGRKFVLRAAAARDSGDLQFCSQILGRMPLTIRYEKPLESGRWYWECALFPTSQARPLASVYVGLCDGDFAWWDRLGESAGSWAWRADGRLLHAGAVIAAGRDAWFNVVNVAVDVDRGAMWVGRDGQWILGGDPATATRPAFGNIVAGLFPAFGSERVKGTVLNQRIALRRDAFRHEVPSGFAPLIDR